MMKPNLVVSTFRLFESVLYRIIYGDFKGIFKGLKRRLKI